MPVSIIAVFSNRASWAKDPPQPLRELLSARLAIRLTDEQSHLAQNTKRRSSRSKNARHPRSQRTTSPIWPRHSCPASWRDTPALGYRKSDGETWLTETRHDLVRGLHTPGSVSPTVREAGALWIKRCRDKMLEAMTIKGYEEHCDLHIYPFIGAKKLSELTVPACNAFADQLRDDGRSAEMIKRVIRSLGAIFKDARRRGLSNVAPTVGLELDLPERDDPRPVIPTKAELQVIIAGATARKSRLWRALVLVAVFCGLRASELRGLRWTDVDFDAGQINVTQRADASHKIGKLKSKAAYRSLRLSSLVLNALREWKLLCPKGDLGLVFPNGIGKVESYANLIDRGFGPIQIEAGVTVQREGVDDAGAPVLLTVAKYGLHALRHACASLWIEQGHNPKQIQTLMGHSSIKVTFDTYGHLFADAEADQRAQPRVWSSACLARDCGPAAYFKRL